MKELSIFIDESGLFNDANSQRFYLVTMVFHNQSIDIEKNIAKLDNVIGAQYIHSYPILRREEEYKDMNIDERRRILYAILNFYNSLNIKHHTFIYDRRSNDNNTLLAIKITKTFQEFFDKNLIFFKEFDKIKIYYDNGQPELNAIIMAVFTLLFNNVDFKLVKSREYRLFQLADFICMVELLNIKVNNNMLTNSEKQFFYRSREIKKVFVRSIAKKRI